jgi:predicted O-methyltransferase YrrM
LCLFLRFVHPPELWSDDDPFKYTLSSNVDNGYGHTNLKSVLIEGVLDAVKPVFWLELGAMLGGSAIRTAQAIKQRPHLSTTVVCVDPWTGDVNMWAWERNLRQTNQWAFMRLEHGAPTIYDRFRANVVAQGVHDVIVPIVSTSMVGMLLLTRLVKENRMSERPDVIFLDSAHEKHETMLELTLAWNTLKPGGVLLGDDWSNAWPGLVEDVEAFSKTITVNDALVTQLERLPEGKREGNVLHLGILWVLCKPL